MAVSTSTVKVKCSVQRPSISHRFDQLRNSLSSSFKPLLREFEYLPMTLNVPETMKTTTVRLLDALVDAVFKFIDQPLLPSQSNFAPIEEIGDPVRVMSIEGKIPDDFIEGVYIRNGPNPLFGGYKSTKSMFGRSSHSWIEGEGMLHALYFSKASDGNWRVFYNNRHVRTDTFKLETQRNKPSFLPVIEGDSPAILSSFMLNLLRFGKVNKDSGNTNIFEHSGKLYAIAENHLPQEIDILTLETLGHWDVNGAWNRPFTSHPKKAPGTGEIVMMGVDAVKPYLEVGVISADGKKLIHKVDLQFNRCTSCHDIGVTERYNVIIDFPVTIDVNRLIRGGPLFKFDKEEFARIGVMPRYGDKNSIKWFDVEPSMVLHFVNCFEDGDEVVVWAIRARGSIIPGPDFGLNKFEWFSRGFKPLSSVDEGNINNNNNDSSSSELQDSLLFSRCYEWRLNMKNGEVKERNLTGTDLSMESPFVNENFVGVKNKYGYAQVADSIASSTSGLAKYGGLAKLYLQEPDPSFSSREGCPEEFIKMEYHQFEDNTFCSGAAFVPKSKGVEEDDGWIVSFVHNEDTDISYAYLIDTKNFCSEPVAKITLPSRVPYGFHGAFFSIIPSQNINKM